jgi:hypothetical protein
MEIRHEGEIMQDIQLKIMELSVGKTYRSIQSIKEPELFSGDGTIHIDGYDPDTNVYYISWEENGEQWDDVIRPLILLENYIKV